MVSILNYSIANVVINILFKVKELDLSFRASYDFLQGLDNEFFRFHEFLSDPQLSENAKDTVVESALRDRINLLVHRSYFEGEEFSGVGSDTLREYLETMVSVPAVHGKLSLFFFFFF
jgi:hypothetical protein